MRFSMKWLLAVTAYVSLATAALISGNLLLGRFLWIFTIVVFSYAVVVAAISRGEHRAVALGFVTLATANFLTHYLAPSKMPYLSFFRTAGYVIQNGEVRQPITDGSGRVTEFRTVASIQSKLPALHAIGTLVAGILGCYLGLLAYRNSGMSIEPPEIT